MSLIRLIDDKGRDKYFDRKTAEDALYRSAIKPNLSWKLPEDSPYDYKDGQIIEKKKPAKQAKPVEKTSED